AVQQQQRAALAAPQLVERQRDPVVDERDHDGAPRNSSTLPATTSGCSMWAKWPAPSTTSSRPPTGSCEMTSSGTVPQPSGSSSPAIMPKNGIARPTSLVSAHSGRHGPNPPKRSVGSSFQRHPSSDSKA